MKYKETKNDLEVLKKFDDDKTIGELIKSVKKVLVSLEENLK